MVFIFNLFALKTKKSKNKIVRSKTVRTLSIAYKCTLANFLSLADGSLDVVTMTLGSSTPAQRYSSSWLFIEATPPASEAMASAISGPASSHLADLANSRASRRRSPSIRVLSVEYKMRFQQH